MPHPILSLLEKPSRLVIGFMSGTSADGVDAALVRITGSGLNTRAEQLAFCCVPYEAEVRTEVLRLASGSAAAAADFCRISFLLGQLFCEAGDRLCEQAGISRSEVDLIGSHGQTFWHIPMPEPFLGHTQRSTLQLGETALLAEHFSCPVVGDFRVRDVAAGGLGAPLVPYTEYLLYRSETECVALQNIGGIGNVTIMPAGCALADVHAFDTGPGNMVMDALAGRITNGRQCFDAEGRMAAAGHVHTGLLAYMMDDAYLCKTPPKTTGRESYGSAYLERLLAEAARLSVSLTDTLATATRFTAESVAYGLKHFAVEQPSRLIVGGGGSLNRTLMAHLHSLLPNCRVMTGEELGFDSQAKEAVAFAVLANECIFASCSNAPGATGASHPAVLGKISF